MSGPGTGTSQNLARDPATHSGRKPWVEATPKRQKEKDGLKLTGRLASLAQEVAALKNTVGAEAEKDEKIEHTIELVCENGLILAQMWQH